MEKAVNGTLFLDEVADLSPEAQVKLLRFLDEGEYYRIGGTKKRTVKTRIISATNRDLTGLVVFRLNLASDSFPYLGNETKIGCSLLIKVQ